jgi:hypothetical protein
MQATAGTPRSVVGGDLGDGGMSGRGDGFAGFKQQQSSGGGGCEIEGGESLSLRTMAPGKVRLGFALHCLTADEEATCVSMVAREQSARLTLMPTHHVGEYGDLTGFRFDCGANASGGCLPISRRMFYGHTMAECLDGEDAILRIMSEPARNKEVMSGFLNRVENECSPALLDCAPDNSDALTGYGLLQGMDLRTIDCKTWEPEVPELIGVYHAYLLGYNRDVRAHKMFIACSGGLEKASDAFCNLLIDLGRKWTAKEVADSEEVWWLRKACHRARCRLIKGAAEALGLRVQHIQVLCREMCVCGVRT